MSVYETFRGNFLTTLPDWLGSTCCGATCPASQGSPAVLGLAHLSGRPSQARDGSEPGLPLAPGAHRRVWRVLSKSESGRDGDSVQKYREETAREKNRILSVACT